MRIMTARVQLKRKMSGHEPERAWHQDELSIGKLTVIK
jgi:hypothetical protein